jgi:hypothetical protein
MERLKVMARGIDKKDKAVTRPQKHGSINLHRAHQA